MDAQIAEAKKALGKVLAERRAYRMLTQAELSEMSGVEEKHILKLEKGEYLPNLETILKLCIALDVKPSELLTPVQEAANPKWRKPKAGKANTSLKFGQKVDAKIHRPK